MLDQQDRPARTRATPLATSLAAFVFNLRFGDLPADLINDISLHALDTLGVCLASVALPYARSLADFVRREGGDGDCTAFGLAGGFPARNAGFYNAALGHGTDFDDTHLVAIAHPSATILPPLLALAEARAHSGEAVLTALIAGIEVMTRLGVACGSALLQRGVHPTSACGAFGAAAAIAKLEGLSEDQIVAALGIVGAMTGGLHQSTVDGSWNKCIHSGLAAQAAFQATALVNAGFAGPASIFDGPEGFFAVFAGVDGDGASRQVLEGLGQRWEAGHLAFKLYPACQGIHPYADCALDLAAEPGFELRRIERIDVRVGEIVGRALCEPVELKHRPPTPYGAKFSIPYVIASALTHGEVTSDSFTPAAIADPAVLRLVDKVHHSFDPLYDEGAALRGWVELKLTDGRTLRQSTVASRGTPQNPWAASGVIDKFLRNATPAIGAERAATVVARLNAFARLDDPGGVARLCRGEVA